MCLQTVHKTTLRMDLGLGRWCLGNMGRLNTAEEEASLLQDRPFSAAASVYISQEKHGRLRHFPASVNLGPGDRRLCMRLVLVSLTTAALLFRYMRHSTIDLSLLHLKRASETQNNLTFSYWVPEHQVTGYFMRSECIKLVLVSFTLISHIVSCMLH